MVKTTRVSSITSEPMALPHTLSADEVASRFDVRPAYGLTNAQVTQRNAQYGPNRLPEPPTRSAWLVFFGQFKSILILILIGAALLSALIGNVKDAVVILAVVVINAVVGFYQEYRAERSLAALKSMLPVKTHVRRESEKHQIAAEELVPGDVVLLEAGDCVPADGRLLVAAGLEIDESALTGESQAVAKHIAALPDPNASLGDRVNMTYMNTMLTRGRAEVVVTATGVHTEMGRLSQELALGRGSTHAFAGSARSPRQASGGDCADAGWAAVLPATPAWHRPRARRSGRDRTGRRSYARRIASGRYRDARARHAEDGATARHRKALGERGNLGMHDSHLFGQDGHAHAKSNDRASVLLPRATIRGLR